MIFNTGVINKRYIHFALIMKSIKEVVLEFGDIFYQENILGLISAKNTPVSCAKRTIEEIIHYVT